MNRDEQAVFIQSLTDPRFRPYLDLAKRYFPLQQEFLQEKKALELYLWASELAGLYQTQISYLEVALRNSISKQLEIWNSAQPPSGSINFTTEWTDQRAGILREIVNSDNIKIAIKNAQLEKGWILSYVPSQDDIISKLMFGFWDNLVTLEIIDPHHARFRGMSPSKVSIQITNSRRRNRRRQRLWKECLHNAFPHRDVSGTLESQRGKISKEISNVRTLRNRIAHHDNILRVNHEKRIEEIKSLIYSIGGDDSRMLNYSKLKKHLDKDPRKTWEKAKLKTRFAMFLKRFKN